MTLSDAEFEQVADAYERFLSAPPEAVDPDAPATPPLVEAEKVRVRIISMEGVRLRDGLMVAKDPDDAIPHLGKEGWMVEDDEAIEGMAFSVPKITLDDGTVLWGFDCWWEPIGAAGAPDVPKPAAGI